MQRYFFVHMMKTGGTTFSQRALANFSPDEVFPTPAYDEVGVTARASLSYLREVAQDDRRRVRFFSGHYPAMAIDLVGGDIRTMTLLREPVARTVSFLRQAKRERTLSYIEPDRTIDDDAPLEVIYENHFAFEAFIHNHQAKLFALTPDDAPDNYMHFLDVDAARLEHAKRRLESIDLIGLNERFVDFVAGAEAQFGWVLPTVADKNVSEDQYAVSEALRARIVEDNRAEVEFYEYARELCSERRVRQGSTT